VAYTVVEAIWIWKLLCDLGIRLSAPAKVYCDNVSASYMIVNPVQNVFSKYIVWIITLFVSVLLMVMLLDTFLQSFS